MVQMNLVPGQEWRHGLTEWTSGHRAGAGRGGWDEPGDQG